MQPSGDNVVEIRDVHFAYNARVILRGLTLDVPRGKVVGIQFIIELDFLKGREKIAGYDVFSLLHY